MNNNLSFFNWSRSKLLATEPDALNKAKINILYTVVLFSLFKVFVVLGIAIYHGQDFQIARSSVLAIVYIVTYKCLLADRKYMTKITHAMIVLGILIICSILFISRQGINIIMLQFIFMITLSSFYILSGFWGIVYSSICIIPVIIHLLFPEINYRGIGVSADELKYPGLQILAILNFITIIIAHYLYHKAFRLNVEEKELLNEQLIEAAQKANNLADSKSQFLSTMSHELRTPLNSVIGITDLLLSEPFHQQQEESLKVLSFSAVSLRTLVNNILDFNKLDYKMLHLETISINIEELMRNITTGLSLQAKAKGVNTHFIIDDAIKSGGRIMTDPTRLTQIIYNLLGNGIKFTEIGDVSLSLKQTYVDGQYVTIRFCVKDTGIGIAAEKHESVFEPFVQASENTTRKFGGTGLGLPIVKKLLKLFDSEIHLQSEPGIGSSFIFDIRFLKDKSETSERTNESIQGQDLKGLKLLIAEDNKLNTFLLERLCKKWNVDFAIVENGWEAVNELKKNDYNLVLMDINMPLMDGYEATELIRNFDDQKKSRTHIIALTASSAEDLHHNRTTDIFDDFILKPFNADELYLKLKQVLADSEIVK